MMIMKRKKQKEQKGVQKKKKRIIKLNDYKDCLFNKNIILNHNKDLEVIIIMYTLNKSIRLQ